MLPKQKLSDKKSSDSTTKSPKSCRAVVDQRVREIVVLYTQGATRTEIIEHAVKMNWGVCVQRIDQYMGEAKKIVLEQNTTSMNDNLAIISKNYWNLYKRAMTPTEMHEMGNIAEARQILTAIAKLKGLDKLLINHIIDDRRDTSLLSDDDLETLLADQVNETATH